MSIISIISNNNSSTIDSVKQLHKIFNFIQMMKIIFPIVIVVTMVYLLNIGMI